MFSFIKETNKVNRQISTLRTVFHAETNKLFWNAYQYQLS